MKFSDSLQNLMQYRGPIGALYGKNLQLDSQRFGRYRFPGVGQFFKSRTVFFGILFFLQTSCSYTHHCIILIFDPGADSGIVISPGVLPPLVKPPLQIGSQKEETDITFGSPLTEIPVDDIKSFYRSEIQYVNFSQNQKFIPCSIWVE